MPGFDREAMVAVAHAHAAAEEAGDMEGNPLYELQPRGVGLRGRDLARRYYEHFFTECMPRITGFTLRSEWVTDEGVGQEYELIVDGAQAHAIIGILTFGDGRLSGERIWASDELLRILFGPLLDEAVPLPA